MECYDIILYQVQYFATFLDEQVLKTLVDALLSIQIECKEATDFKSICNRATKIVCACVVRAKKFIVHERNMLTTKHLKNKIICTKIC